MRYLRICLGYSGHILAWLQHTGADTPHCHPNAQPQSAPQPSMHTLPPMGLTGNHSPGRASPVDERLAARDDLYGA